MKRIKKNRYELIEYLGYIRINRIYKSKIWKKSKRIDMKGLYIYIKDITKQVFLKDLGFTYLQYLQTN